MKALLCLSLLTTVFGFQFGWSSFLDDDLDSWNLDRRSACIGQSGKCFSSGQCCRGFVCAAFDDLFGEQPEIPGYCVREKDLRKCQSSIECKDGAKCLPLGRKKILYCVHDDDLPEEPKFQENSVGMGRYSGSKSDGRFSGTKGSKCQNDDDCQGKDKSGRSLCCQEVRKYRQKAKRICDVITPISICIAKRR